MMVSDFIALVGRIAHLNITAIILVAIASIVLGAITRHVATGIESAIVLTVASLIALLIWFRLWETGETMWGMLFTVSITMVGWELYKRVVGMYR
jgi:hypothetical protein